MLIWIIIDLYDSSVYSGAGMQLRCFYGNGYDWSRGNLASGLKLNLVDLSLNMRPMA